MRHLRGAKRLLAIGLAAMLLLVPGGVAAQELVDFAQGGFLLRVDGDVVLSADDVTQTMLVINGEALIEGQTETLIVIDGTATLAGATVKDLIVISGSADLEEGTRVTGDVTTIDSEVTQASGAVVEGEINKGTNFQAWVVLWVAWFVFYVGVTIALLVLGVFAAAIAGRQMREASRLITDETGYVALGALIVAIGAPVLALLTLVTVVGIPLAIAIFLSLGGLAILGYLVAAVRVGDAILVALRGRPVAGHPYWAVVIGVFVLQVLAPIPFVGTLIWILAQLAGVGAIAVMAWRGFRGTSGAAGAGATAAQPPPGA